jgi:hypothetical protein
VVWDGAKWIPAPAVPAPVTQATSRRVWVWVAVGAVVIFIGLIAIIGTISSGSGDSNARRGITDVSWTSDQIKFDYNPDKTCSVIFHYVFSDAQGNVLSEADDTSPSRATSGEKYHVTITPVDLSSNVPDKTARIDITPNCQ